MVATMEYSRTFDYNVGILKQYTEDFIKLIRFPKLRQSGWEETKPKKKSIDEPTLDENTRLENSISRSKSKVFELALCNEWQYMVTVTQDEKKRDRYNLSSLKKSHGDVIRNHNAYHDTDIRYLTVPEPHKDGAWHMHGLYMGIPDSELTPYTLDMKLPHSIRKKLLAGKQVYNWSLLSERFGWVVVEPIESRKGCAGYISKYITKELAKSKVKFNEHLYYCSRGLKRAKVLYRNTIINEFEPDFQNDYVSIKTYDNLNDAIQPFIDGELKQEDIISWERNEPMERKHTTTTKRKTFGILNLPLALMKMDSQSVKPSMLKLSKRLKPKVTCSLPKCVRVIKLLHAT